MIQSSDETSFGHFLTTIPPSDEFLTLNFSLSVASRNALWRNNGLSADFLGDYFAAFFPGESLDQSEISRQSQVQGCVSYIANELLENAVKYSEKSIKSPISITLYLYEQAIIFKTTNLSNLLITRKYQDFIGKLLQEDPSSLYIEQLEKTAMGTGGSNMGLLTMINDYETRFGWQFLPLRSQPNIFQVSVMAHLSV